MGREEEVLNAALHRYGLTRGEYGTMVSDIEKAKGEVEVFHYTMLHQKFIDRKDVLDEYDKQKKGKPPKR